MTYHRALLQRSSTKVWLVAVLIASALIMLLPMASASAATTVGNNVSVGGTLAATGATTLNGAVTLGDATGDSITVRGRLAADLDPNADNSINLGAFGLAYSDIYASGTIYLSSVNVLENGNITFGTSTSNTITPTARFAGDLDPSTNNARDFGLFGNAWNDLFASGTVYAGVYEGVATSTFNEQSGDYDFRVESNNKTHALFVDAGNDLVSFGSTTPNSEYGIDFHNNGATSSIAISSAGSYTGGCLAIEMVNGGFLFLYADAGGRFVTSTGILGSAEDCTQGDE